MTETTQPHPEPSEEASSLPDRITSYLANGGLFNPELANHDAVRDLLIDCRIQLNAMRVERDAALADAEKWQMAAVAAMNLVPRDLSNLAPESGMYEAAPVVDVERIMALAEDLEAEAVYATRSGNLDRVRAAREALRASLASPEGSQHD